MNSGSDALAVVLVAAVALAALPAAAVDGEILIDQAKVMAGGITPGDDPGFPATLTRPGRYKLTGNLTMPAGQHGIEVTRDEVAIDLNGFTISTKPFSDHNGVHASSVSGLRVMNGTITGFAYGIYNLGGRALVEDMRLVTNLTGVYSEGDSQIRNSTIAMGRIGIYCVFECLIERNVVAANTAHGIDTLGAGVVLGNVIASNGRYGLRSPGGPYPKTGYGNNILFGNNNGGAQISGAVQLHPNVCEPACP
jgi:hypothetical protein